MKNNKKEFSFPPEEEMQKVIKRFSDPNYNRVNIGLMPNATTEDKIKHNLCKSIVQYARKNNLTEKELTQKLGIDQVRTEYVLFCHINKLTFQELTVYVDNLHIPLKIKIDKQHGREKTTPIRAH